ncbi:MAG: ECF transporter S component [Anaerolineales bacterium]|nr:ECF transporter S component [Anaerolineales bacterium]
MATTTQRHTGLFLIIVVNLIGVVAFAAPFFSQAQAQTSDVTNVRSGESLLLMLVLMAVCLVVLLAQLGASLNTKSIALMGVLLAVNSVLRLLDLLVPMPGGFSPIFLLIILIGYAYGAQLGFLMGSLTLFASALFTGGVGPWLPFQMFTAGWIGVLAGLLPHRLQRYPHVEVWLLAAFGAVMGMAYGFIINLYFWPFFAGTAEQSWQTGLSLGDSLSRYLVFYGITSAVWDIFRAIGNFVLLMALGPALLRALRRFHARFFTEIVTV